MRDEQTEPILPHHLWAGILIALAGKALETMPRTVAANATTAAPWAVVLAGAVALGLFWPVAATLARRPGANLVSLALDAGGRPLALLLAPALGAFLLVEASLSLRQAAEMAVTAVYPHTPQTFVMTTLTAVSALGAAMRSPGLLWLAALWTWPALAGFALVLLGNVSWGQFRYLFPITGPGLPRVALEVLPMTSHYAELIYLAVLASVLASPQRLPRIAAYVVGGTAVTWAAVVAVSLMVFPLPGGLAVPFPLFEMTRLVLAGRFLERVDSFWVIFWTVGSITRGALALHITSLLLRDAFRLPTHRGAVLPLAVTTVAAALFPSSQADAIAVQSFVLRKWGFLAALVLPLLIVLVARVRRPAGGGGGGPGEAGGRGEIRA